MVAILTGVKCNLRVVLLLIFIGLMAKNADHFFFYLLATILLHWELFVLFIYLLSGSLLKDEQNTSVKLSHILVIHIHGAWLQMNKALSISISHFMLSSRFVFSTVVFFSECHSSYTSLPHPHIFQHLILLICLMIAKFTLKWCYHYFRSCRRNEE